MTFELIRERAEAAWRDFAAPHGPRVLIGTGTCGRAAGAARAANAARSWFERKNTATRICNVGCLGLCYAEPLVELHRPGAPRVLYGNVEDENIEELLHRYYEKDDLEILLSSFKKNASMLGVALLPFQRLFYGDNKII